MGLPSGWWTVMECWSGVGFLARGLLVPRKCPVEPVSSIVCGIVSGGPIVEAEVLLLATRLFSFKTVCSCENVSVVSIGSRLSYCCV